MRSVPTGTDYASMGGLEFYNIPTNPLPPGRDSALDQNDTVRGNVTAVESFSDVSNGISTTRRRKYDIFGNVITAEVSCCAVKTAVFGDNTGSDTYYSQPLSTTDGVPGTAPFLTTTYVYNFNTSLVTQTTDPDGNTTFVGYDSALRPLTVTSPAGATTTTTFDKDANQLDLLAYSQKVTYNDAGVTKTVTSKSWFDGAGRAIRSGVGTGPSPTSFDASAAVYDSLGRPLKQSNPYVGNSSGIGSPAYWTANVYDLLSRVTEVDLPDDQPSGQRSRITTLYSGATVTVTDQVGRKRKSQADGLGRLISVTEQDPANGSLSLVTNYSYDPLDNLTSVNQGGQTRTFSYDSLSRLLSQNTPEGGAVSLTYTDFGAVLKLTDQRNVESHFKYDTLNRLIKVWYTGLGGNDSGTVRPALPSGVAETSDIDITYNTTAPGNGAAASISDGQGMTGFSTSESYDYDGLGRLQSKTRTIDGIAYQTQYQYNQLSQATLMIYPSGKRVRMNYDARGRAIGEDKVDGAGTVLTSYLSNIGYNVAGQVTGMTLGNGVSESFSYSADRLQLTGQTAVKGAATLMSLSYSYSAAAGQSGASTSAGNSGQLMTITGTINGQNRNQAFTYDDNARLVTATGTGATLGAWQRRFGYDRWGNRTGMWDATSGGNQIQSVGLQLSGGVPTNRFTSVTNSGNTSKLRLRRYG